jgi:replicative DNA helicase
MIHDSTANERAFIGCLLRSPHDFWQVNDTVTADCFVIAAHREIFTAIRDLSERGKQVTVTALQANLPEEIEDSPTIGILMALKESAAEAGSATDYAGHLAERTALKRLDGLAEWLRKDTRRGDRSAEDISAELMTRAQAISATATPLRPVKLSEITKRVVTFSSKAHQKDVMPGFSTGLSALDEMVGLLMGGDFVGIIGALGDGKSALLAQ